MRSKGLRGPGRDGGAGRGRLALDDGDAGGRQVAGRRLEDGKVFAIVSKAIRLPWGDGGQVGARGERVWMDNGAWRYLDVVGSAGESN